MTTTTFETTDYGIIEITRFNSNSFAGEAYFRNRDWLVDVDETGNFADLDGFQFKVYYTFFKDVPATIEVIKSIRIASAFPVPSKINMLV